MTNLKFKFLHLFLIASTSLNAIATEFDDVLNEVVTNNLSTKIEGLRLDSQLESMKSENELEAPEIEFARLWGSNNEVGNKWELSVNQGFDWPGLYAARRNATKSASYAMQYLYESALIETKKEVRTLLIDIIHNTQLIEAQTKLVERMNLLEEYFKRASDEGNQTKLDYNKTVVERIAVHRELHQLEAQRVVLLSSLETLNGGKDVNALVAKLGNRYPSFDKEYLMPSIQRLKERDPQYAAAKANAESAKSLVKVEKLSRYPGFSLGYVHETEAGGDFNGFSVGVTLPFLTKRHSSKAAVMEAEAALLDAEMQLSRRLAEMKGDYNQLEALKIIIEEYEPVVSDQNNYELLKKAFDAGQIDYLTYLQEVNFFIAANRDYIDTLYEYNMALSRLAIFE